jgi:hypothetical protein
MANSYVEYSSGLTATTYSIPFKYIAIADVEVKGYNGSTWADLTVASRNNTAKTITLSVAPSTYQKIRVWRNTSTTQLVDFQNGSRLSESDLDTAYQQGLYVAQEVSENASATGYPATGAEGVSISSVTSSTNAGVHTLTFTGSDGVTKGTVNVTDGTDGTDPFDASGNLIVTKTSAGASITPLVLHNASSDANTDVRMLLAPCTTAADRPVILAATNDGGNVCDFTVFTPNGGTPVERMRIKGNGEIILSDLPTTQPSTTGAIWNDGGTLKIV